MVSFINFFLYNPISYTIQFHIQSNFIYNPISFFVTFSQDLLEQHLDESGWLPSMVGVNIYIKSRYRRCCSRWMCFSVFFLCWPPNWNLNSQIQYRISVFIQNVVVPIAGIIWSSYTSIYLVVEKSKSIKKISKKKSRLFISSSLGLICVLVSITCFFTRDLKIFANDFFFRSLIYV